MFNVSKKGFNMPFKMGDVVQLKSGGPVMTIEHVNEHGHCTCIWFSELNSPKTSKQIFESEVLMPFE